MVRNSPCRRRKSSWHPPLPRLQRAAISEFAPGATIIPVARRFAPDGQYVGTVVSRVVLDRVSEMSPSERALADATMARAIMVDYAHYDIVNRSFGSRLFDSAGIQGVLDDEMAWWGDRLRQLLPRTWRALHCKRESTPMIVQWWYNAAGNEKQDLPGLEANLPFHEPHARGHHLSVDGGRQRR